MLNDVLKRLFGIIDSKMIDRFSDGSSSRQPSQIGRSRRLNLEPLEARELLSVTSFELKGVLDSANVLRYNGSTTSWQCQAGTTIDNSNAATFLQGADGLLSLNLSANASSHIAWKFDDAEASRYWTVTNQSSTNAAISAQLVWNGTASTSTPRNFSITFWDDLNNDGILNTDEQVGAKTALISIQWAKASIGADQPVPGSAAPIQIIYSGKSVPDLLEIENHLSGGVGHAFWDIRAGDGLSSLSDPSFSRYASITNHSWGYAFVSGDPMSSIMVSGNFTAPGECWNHDGGANASDVYKSYTITKISDYLNILKFTSDKIANPGTYRLMDDANGRANQCTTVALAALASAGINVGLAEQSVYVDIPSTLISHVQQAIKLGFGSEIKNKAPFAYQKANNNDYQFQYRGYSPGALGEYLMTQGGTRGNFSRLSSAQLNSPLVVVSAPTAPANFKSDANSLASDAISLTWTAQAGLTAYALKYKKSADPDVEANWKTCSPAPGITAATATVTGLAANTAYDFKLTATNSAGSATATTSATTKAATPTAPAAPTNFAAAKSGNNSITLSWAASDKAEKYTVYRYDTGKSQWVAINTVSATTLTYTDLGLALGREYSYRITASNEGGESSPTETKSVDLEQNIKADTQILVRENTAAKTDSYAKAQAAQLAWLNEWNNFWVEIWAKPEAAGRITAFSGCDFGYEYDNTLFTLDTVELGPQFTGTPNTATPGVIALSGQASDDTTAGEWVLLARVGFQPARPTAAQPDVGVPLGQNGDVTSLPFSFSLPAEMSVTTREGAASPTTGIAELEAATMLPVYPVLYDLNDDGTINIADFTLFAQAFGRPITLNSAASKFDFNRDGSINIADFTMFAQAFGNSRATGFSNTLLPDMPQWASASVNAAVFSTAALFVAEPSVEISAAPVLLSTDESVVSIDEDAVASDFVAMPFATLFAGEQSAPGFAFENAFASDVAWIATCYETATDVRETMPTLLTAASGYSDRTLHDRAIESLFGEENDNGDGAGDTTWDALLPDILATVL